MEKETEEISAYEFPMLDPLHANVIVPIYIETMRRRDSHNCVILCVNGCHKCLSEFSQNALVALSHRLPTSRIGPERVTVYDSC